MSFQFHKMRSISIIIIIIIIIITVMMMMMIVIKTMIIIASKGSNRDFYKLLTAPRTVSNTYAQLTRALSFANHVQRIERFSRATCRYTTLYEGTAQLHIKFDRV